jgi:uncharacterized RDD family membrane protein YckC
MALVSPYAFLHNHMERYQTFWPRFWAGFVDGLVFIPITILDAFLAAPERSAAVIIVWSTISYSVSWLYSVLLHARYGQTLGKMAAQVKVLDISEERIPTLRQAFIRDIGYIVLNTLSLIYLIYLVAAGQYVRGGKESNIPGQILGWAALGWFLLEIISMATNSKRRAFHDFIAKTVVVRDA